MQRGRSVQKIYYASSCTIHVCLYRETYHLSLFERPVTERLLCSRSQEMKMGKKYWLRAEERDTEGGQKRD